LIEIIPLASVDPAAIEQLLDLAFGVDRHGRTAYRLRDGIEPIAGLSFAAMDGAELVGSIQCWPVQLAAGADGIVPLILVGPVAVRPDRQRSGIGRQLMERTLARAADDDDGGGGDPMMLIGDADYYDRFFGFSAQHTGGWTVPGPVDRDRLLARLRPDQRLPRRGALGPRRPVAGARDQALVPDRD
jgi:predicted N-acetyltransferase YhbS